MAASGKVEARRFLIIDDHPLFVEALQSALEAGFPGATIDVAHTIGAASAFLEKAEVDLVLLDLILPDVSGLEGVLKIRGHAPRTPLAVVSAMNGSDVIGRARAMGVNGFIPKGNPRQEIIRAINLLLSGESSFPAVEQGAALAAGADAPDDFAERLKQLTPQQLKVLAKVCEAKLNKQIAFELGVTETTIKAHITLIFKKLKVHSRTQAVLEMQRIRAELGDGFMPGLAGSDR